MRIAYVLGTSAGGMGTHVAMLARGCAAAGHEVMVFAPEETCRRFFAEAACGEGPGAGPLGALEAARSGRVNCQPLDVSDRLRPVSDSLAVLRLHRESHRWRPGVVHAHGMRAGGLAALARMRGPAGQGRPRTAPLAVTVHNAPATGGTARAVATTLEWLVARNAAAVLWVSPDLGERMRRRGARDAGRALVPAPARPAPSPAVVEQAREALGGAGRPVVLMVGRLAPQKGHAVLLRAAATWRDSAPVPLLAFAGDGPLAGELAALARALGTETLFLGERQDIPALMAAADVIAVPSLWEGQPLVVQEALRLGRPLVASRVGGVPSLTGEDGAILVPPGDPQAFAAAVTAVIDDQALASRLAAAALARASLLPSTGDAVEAALTLYRRMAVPRADPAAGA